MLNVQWLRQFFKVEVVESNTARVHLDQKVDIVHTRGRHNIRTF